MPCSNDPDGGKLKPQGICHSHIFRIFRPWGRPTLSSCLSRWICFLKSLWVIISDDKWTCNFYRLHVSLSLFFLTYLVCNAKTLNVACISPFRLIHSTIATSKPLLKTNYDSPELWWLRRDLNPHVRWTLDPEPSASASFATRAFSGMDREQALNPSGERGFMPFYPF